MNSLACAPLLPVRMFRSNNITARIFERQICTPAPGTSIHRARLFYEDIVPSYTVYDVECPDHSFRKFTDDGLYLISFSRDLQDLIVYRPTWLSFSCNEEDCNGHELPPKAKKFESFFTQLYSVSLASSGEVICKDFFLYLESNQFGLFATSTATAQVQDAPSIIGAVHGIPSIEKITFHLLRCMILSSMDKYNLLISWFTCLFSCLALIHLDWKMELYLMRGFSAMIILIWHIILVFTCMIIC